MSALAYAFISILTVSLVSLVGVFTLSFKEKLIRRSIFFLVALSVGVLLGDVFIHLLPELYEMKPNTLLLPLGVFTGFLLFFTLEKFLHWQHCHSSDEAEKEFHSGHSKTLASLVITSDGLHNFIDGVLIAVAYLVNIPLGIATTVAVVFHEIPQEIGDFGLLLHGGLTVKKALFYNFLSALMAFLGLVVGWWLGVISEQFIFITTAVTAGGFLYIASADIVPELHKTTKPAQSVVQLLGIIIGFAIMVLLLMIE